LRRGFRIAARLANLPILSVTDPAMTALKANKRVVLAVAALALGGAYALWQFRPPAVAPPQAPPPISVTAAVAAIKNVPVYVRGLGTVQAFNTVRVATRVDGQITKVFFTEGQEVEAGDPLFQIDPRPFRAALDQAEAARERDQAQLKGAQVDLERYGKLLPSGWQTRQSYEDQQATVGQLQGLVRADEAQIDRAKLNLGYATVVSPLAGRTGARLVDIGNFVQAAQGTALVMIAQIKPIFVNFTLPQDFLDRVRNAQTRHSLTVLAFTNNDETKLAEGTLSLINNQVDASTATVVMKATFDNNDERLWPGQLVSARVILSTKENVVTVPVSAVLEGSDGDYVYVIKADNTVEHRDVIVALSEEGLAVIEKGLAAGEAVVVEGQGRLSDGARIKVSSPQGARQS
jgi:membrane fusion protein, multidrug efflux system